MLDWLRRVFGRSDGDDGQRFFETLDALNVRAGGGEPVPTTRLLGRLKLRSGTLTLGDPQYVPDLEVPNVAADEAQISGHFSLNATGSTRS